MIISCRHCEAHYVLRQFRSTTTITDTNKGQSHLAIDSIAANIMSYGVGDGTVGALLISYRLSIVTITLSVTVWPQSVMQIFTGASDPQISPTVGDRGPYLIQYYLLGTTRVSLPNDISFCPTALAECTSVTDEQTDRRTVTSVAIDGSTES